MARNGLWRAAAAPAIVFTVRVAVAAAAPEIAGGCETEHVGVSTAPAGLAVTAHARATVPVKPPLGVTVMVEVALDPGEAILTGVPLSVKAPAGGGGDDALMT
jgi:hypothetical protein